MTKAQPALATEILSYFLQNPEAADGLEGVARWRLQEEQIRQQVTAAGAALEWLVENGFLQRISSPVAGPIYRLNQAKRSEAQYFVQRSKGHPQRRNRKGTDR